MPKFDTFEDQTKILLSEESPLDVVQQSLERMTPGVDLFKGPGVVTNKYESNKNYYPNIRSGFGGLFNKDMDNMNQSIITYIDSLNKSYTNILRDPTQLIPSAPAFTTPASPSVKNYVTEVFSSEYIQKEITRFEESLKEIQSLLLRLQGYKTPSFIALIKALQAFSKVQDISKNNQPDPRNTAKVKQLIQLLDDYIKDLETNKSTAFASLTFSQRSDYVNNINNFKESLQEWQVILKADPFATNSQVPVDNVPPIGQFLNKEAKIYRDLFGDFLATLSNAVVGSSQGRWGTGPNVYSLLIGTQRGRAAFRGKLTYKDDITTISPNILKSFHETFMTDFFINTKILIYATPEQWESISQGGKFRKGIEFLGKQAFTAGQNRPKVTL